MSAPAAPAGAAWPGGGPGGRALRCTHAPGEGSLDESARRLSHAEFAVGRRLAGEGHTVHSNADWPWLGPSADLQVCGHPVEVKSFLAFAEHPTRSKPTAVSVCNKLLDGSRQGDIVVIWGPGSGLTRGAAAEGVRLFGQKAGWDRVTAVRVMGDGFDLAWGSPARTAARGWRRSAGARTAQPAGARTAQPAGAVSARPAGEGAVRATGGVPAHARRTPAGRALGL